MKRLVKKGLALTLASTLALSMTACGSDDSGQTTTNDSATNEASSDEEVVISFTWWGSQERHDLTQKCLDLYTELNPNVKFEAYPAGWEGYFDKLSTQAASGAMPDIIQMDYLYINTFANNGTLADLTPYIEDGTIDVSNIDENILNTGVINDQMNGFAITTNTLATTYNPDVLAEVGIEMPEEMTWSQFIELTKQSKDTTGTFGDVSKPTAEITNFFHAWVRQHGYSLFSEDNKSLGFDDPQIMIDYLNMWKDLIDYGASPNPDETAQILTLGQEALPVVTGETPFCLGWSNFPSSVSGVNENLELALYPLPDDSSADSGVYLKPSMFFSISEQSEVKDEAAKFIDWYVNSPEANEIMLGSRGVPVSSEARSHLVNSNLLDSATEKMFAFIDKVEPYCGVTPKADPVGVAEINQEFSKASDSVFYGQQTAEEATEAFMKKANEILERSN